MLTQQEFITIAINKVPAGSVLKNPGKGKSTIIKYDNERLCYKRGDSSFYVDLGEFASAYNNFLGKFVTTTKLKEYKPEIFDSNNEGHNCHCTLLFLYLKEMGLVDTIHGRGKVGSPFGVQL